MHFLTVRNSDEFTAEGRLGRFGSPFSSIGIVIKCVSGVWVLMSRE